MITGGSHCALVISENDTVKNKSNRYLEFILIKITS